MVHAYSLLPGNLIWMTFDPQVTFADNKQTLMSSKQLRTYWTIGPSLEVIGKQRFVENRQRISLSGDLRFLF